MGASLTVSIQRGKQGAVGNGGLQGGVRDQLGLDPSEILLGSQKSGGKRAHRNSAHLVSITFTPVEKLRAVTLSKARSKAHTVHRR